MHSVKVNDRGHCKELSIVKGMVVIPLWLLQPCAGIYFQGSTVYIKATVTSVFLLLFFTARGAKVT